jgi:hypothetical protein
LRRGKIAAAAGVLPCGTTGSTETTENIAIVARGPDIRRHDCKAREWSTTFKTLKATEPLPGFSATDWLVLIADGTRFLNCWGVEADRRGSTALNLFGAHPTVPAARCDAMGLVLLIREG